MSEEKKSKGGVWQFIKFALFSASAGIIQVLSFTLMSEVIIKLPALKILWTQMQLSQKLCKMNTALCTLLRFFFQ